MINPYKVEIVESAGDAGMIIDAGGLSLTVAAINGKALKMSDLRLYRFPLFTKFFINAIGKTIKHKGK